MKNSATTNKQTDATKIAPGASANKPTDAKNTLANVKNIKGNKATPVQVEEEVIPPPPKESKLFNYL